MNKLQATEQLEQLLVKGMGEVREAFVLRSRLNLFKEFAQNEEELSKIFEIEDLMKQLEQQKKDLTVLILHEKGFVKGTRFVLFGDNYKITDDELHYRLVNKNGEVSARGSQHRMTFFEEQYAQICK